MFKKCKIRLQNYSKYIFVNFLVKIKIRFREQISELSFVTFVKEYKIKLFHNNKK